MKGRTVGVTLSLEQAQALHWFMRHIGFVDALRTTPPHMDKEVRAERAYGIVHAAAELEYQIAKAGQHGDRWMYAGNKAGAP